MNGSTQLAEIVMDGLAASGVRDVVLSPGSRSTPLALAFGQYERAGLIRLHVRIDERSAGYLALGLAKDRRQPVALLCTSGTAVANLAPAVVEANYAGLPLIVLTADRPERLRHVGANQTIDQVGYFGQHVRTSKDVHADGSRGDANVQRTAVRSALQAAIGRPDVGPGPVHINLAFDEPLVPDAPISLTEPATPVTTESVREPLDFLLADMGLAHVPERGVFLVGDVPTQQLAQQVRDLTDSLGWPVIAEPSGNVMDSGRAISHASLMLAAGTEPADDVECVVTIGRFGLSRPVVNLVRRADRHLAVWLGGRDRPDPLRSADLVVAGVPRRPTHTQASTAWLSDWRQASEGTGRRLERVLSEQPLSGPAVAQTVWRATDASDQLFLASSRTVRYFEAVAGQRTAPAWVAGNRGASGIDGLISTAWGMASAHQHEHPQSRMFAVLGDLAFLHDHNGLLVPANEARPAMTIVVIDNDGGGIFSSLEQGAPEYQSDFERVFGTPHGVDLVAVAAATGVDAARVSSVAELAAALASPWHGVRTIVVPTQRKQEAEVWTRLCQPE